MDEPKGLIKSIFDFSFSEFVTPKVIKFLLGLAMVMSAISAIVIIVRAFNVGVLAGIVVLLLSPVIYCLLMLVARIYLELVIVMFKIAGHLDEIKKSLGGEKAEAAVSSRK
jgi:Domain of unknown function (DUF4282)